MSVQSGGLLFDLISDAVIVLDVHDRGEHFDIVSLQQADQAFPKQHVVVDW
jgi:hypothetical protein